MLNPATIRQWQIVPDAMLDQACVRTMKIQAPIRATTAIMPRLLPGKTLRRLITVVPM
jgi:hypothetical protein